MPTASRRKTLRKSLLLAYGNPTENASKRCLNAVEEPNAQRSTSGAHPLLFRNVLEDLPDATV